MKLILPLAVTCLALPAAHALGSDCSSARGPLFAPEARVLGHTQDELMRRYANWFWPTFYGVPGPPGNVGPIAFLPVPIGGGELTFTVRPGRPLVLPLTILSGERYDNPAVPDDDPAAFFPDEYLDFELRIDGELVLDSDVDDPERYLFDLALINPPFEYPEPEYRFTDDELGDINAVAAIWTQGTACVLRPLRKGQHTVVVDLYFPSFDAAFTNTLHIIVSEGGGNGGHDGGGDDHDSDSDSDSHDGGKKHSSGRGHHGGSRP